MNIKDLPFSEAKVEVLRFDPWTKKNDNGADFIFEYQGDFFAVKSPYAWRKKKFVHGDIISVKKQVEKFDWGIRGKLKFLEKVSDSFY